MEIGTSITVAFARSPMTTAQSANDLQALSRGRFILGLGSQIKAHIERRFSMPWSEPDARMREYVAALRAIWDCWHSCTRLEFRGDFYTHTLMPPFFRPNRGEHGPPKVYLAGVGERMTEVAGEVCDGFICHGFTTERYVREVTIPALERGRARVGKTLDGFDICGPSFVVTGETEQKIDEARHATKRQIAFYGSTPAYRHVLELHGWGGLQAELNSLTKQDRWAEMPGLVDDEVLDAFAVVGTPVQVGAQLLERHGDTRARISFYAPYLTELHLWDAARSTLQSAERAVR
jgi:probable F420-dependent oxidoreductase